MQDSNAGEKYRIIMQDSNAGEKETAG